MATGKNWFPSPEIFSILPLKPTLIRNGQIKNRWTINLSFDWKKQWQCSMDPEAAKRIRDDRAPEHEDSCSMYGKFCAVRRMNKALAGECIDIL